MDIIVHLSKEHYFKDFPIFCSLIDHLFKELCENGLTMKLKLEEESLEKSFKKVRGIYYKNMFIAQTLQAVKFKTTYSLFSLLELNNIKKEFPTNMSISYEVQETEKNLLEQCIKEIMEFITSLETKLFAITSAAQKPLFSITNDDVITACTMFCQNCQQYPKASYDQYFHLMKLFDENRTLGSNFLQFCSSPENSKISMKINLLKNHTENLAAKRNTKYQAKSTRRIKFNLSKDSGKIAEYDTQIVQLKLQLLNKEQEFQEYQQLIKDPKYAKLFQEYKKLKEDTNLLQWTIKDIYENHSN
ncbi:hypothetical protein T4D_10502 [Trichinella pseudospiralis]|uniref:Uncharacterized protein n=1 Tax=Trichinella pseudospiralis TaxID=6337 RepID=A0A0V1G4P2_TRIPS|nr:hypothetical protein T4D_10502 [Trichinella pseudospiralis]